MKIKICEKWIPFICNNHNCMVNPDTGEIEEQNTGGLRFTVNKTNLNRKNTTLHYGELQLIKAAEDAIANYNNKN